MKKFSKLNESKEQEILGWAPNEILKELSTIPNCNVSYKCTQFIFRDEGHEIVSLEDIQRGEIKTDYFQHTLDPEYVYHPQHSFVLDFGNLFGNQDKLLFFDKGKELQMDEIIPLDMVTKLFSDIERATSSLRSDFYIHIWQNKPLSFHHFEIELDFTMKDSAEKEYILK
jgi:hypothetical protein